MKGQWVTVGDNGDVGGREGAPPRKLVLKSSKLEPQLEVVRALPRCHVELHRAAPLVLLLRLFPFLFPVRFLVGVCPSLLHGDGNEGRRRQSQADPRTHGTPAPLGTQSFDVRPTDRGLPCPSLEWEEQSTGLRDQTQAKIISKLSKVK